MKLTFNKVVPEPIPRPLIASSKIWEEEITWASNDRILVQAQSGKGKSTLLHLIYGLRKDYSGSWEIDSVQAKDLSADDWHILRARKISLLFQDLRRRIPHLESAATTTVVTELCRHNCC